MPCLVQSSYMANAVRKITLSQRRNILFTACKHQVYVWVPSGASEMINSSPEMIITPVMKNPRASGYILPRSPHAINNILVDDLGCDEVLVLATDSGNVCAYHVEAICSALEWAAEFDQERPLDDSYIHPFFTEYVGMSAWGLAIHKFARLIAVSANTHQITVFAFAIVDPSGSGECGGALEASTGDEDYDYDHTWEVVDSPEKLAELRQRLDFSKIRSRNIRLTYKGHNTNIPTVSFFNTDIDPNGNWLLSTDIDNRVIVWKLWSHLCPYNVNSLNTMTDRLSPPHLIE